MSALRVSVPGEAVRFVDIRYGCNGRSARTAIGGGTIVRPGPTLTTDDKAKFTRQEYRKRNHDREIAQQRARRAAGKR